MENTTAKNKNLNPNVVNFKKIPNIVILQSGKEGYELLLSTYVYLAMTSNSQEDALCTLELLGRTCEIGVKDRSIKFDEYLKCLESMTYDVTIQGKGEEPEVVISQLVSIRRPIDEYKTVMDVDEITKGEELLISMETPQKQIQDNFTALEYDEYYYLQSICLRHKLKSRKSISLVSLLKIYMLIKMTVQRYAILEPYEKYQHLPRAYIEKRTGLSAGTVSSYVKMLVQNGMIEVLEGDYQQEMSNEYRLSEKWREME